MRTALLYLCILVSFRLSATHIVGGELIYDFLGKSASGKDIYRITLKVYRDCNKSTNADFDGTGGPGSPLAYLTISGNGKDTVIDLGAPTVSDVPPSINSNCVQVPYVCVQQGIYTTTLELTPAQGGYHLVYQRCCRNNTILNLTNPGNQGSTYYARIPGPEEVVGNSSPRFTKFPPLFLCTDLPFYFDHSATDPDGDQLVYGLAGSFDGLDPCCPALLGNPGSSANCPSPPSQCPTKASLPPYGGVKYAAPFSASYPVASNPSISIDPVTGKLTGRPNMIGQFVVCMEVREYRNGQLIDIHYRDFQFNVTSCQVSVISDMADQVFKCIGNVITFTNQSVSNTGALTYKWDFGVPNLSSDTAITQHPTYTYKDTGMYMVTLIGNPGKTCSDTIRKPFYVYPLLNVRFDKSPLQCLRYNNFSFKAGGSYHSTAKFSWEFGSVATPSVTQDKDPSNIRYSAAGRFNVMLIGKQLMCVDTFIDTIRVIHGPEARITTPEMGACRPATVQLQQASISGEPLKYRWRFSNGTSSDKPDPTVTFTNEGVYSATLMVTTDKVCRDTSIASISHLTVHPVPVAAFSFQPRITTILDPLISFRSLAGAGLSYSYDFGDGMGAHHHNPEHVYYDYGNYTITQYVTNAYGCTDSVSDIVQILPEHRFWIPTAFTPDGDTRNDVFRPVATGISHYLLQVFNRWGDLLFETDNLGEGWNGRFRGSDCKQDVYVWKVRYKDIVKNESYERTGQVTLIKSP